MLINNYVRAKQEEKFYVEDFAKFTGFPITQIQHYLINLANNGFIFYDFSEERVSVQPTLYNYINATSEIGDYDVIAFNSKVKSGSLAAVNAALVLSAGR